jgi:hypothetical protein
MQALTLSMLFHWWVLSSTPMMGDFPSLTEVNGCKLPSGRRRNKNKKKIEIEGTEEQKKNIFYTFIPPVWLQFQTAADRCHDHRCDDTVGIGDSSVFVVRDAAVATVDRG